MGSKKHKKHHKYEKRERSHDVLDRPEKRLKLVLKVGGSSASEHGDSPHVHHPAVEQSNYVHDDSRAIEYERYSEKHKKSKKKKKKKSSERHEKKHKHHHHHTHEKRERRKRELDDSGQDDIDVLDMNNEPMLKRNLFGEDVPERPYREPRACTLKNRQGKSALQHLLDYLLKALEKKDPQQVFAWPVTDHIAPGYSSIITHPMDFSTMRQKIENNEYQSIADFKADLKLMCDNCMTYNRSDTIYFKAAKKMLHIGFKMMTKDKLLPLRLTLTYMNELTSDELGFDLNDETFPVETGVVEEIDENAPAKEVKKKIKPSKPTSKFEAYEDGLSPEEILAEAQKSASKAAAKLTLKRPNTKFGFLRQLKDGTTTLAVLSPEEGAPKEKKVTLEMLTGKLTQGTGTLAGFQEDKRNIVKPVNYLNYGSYSSFAPVYDSTFANLTKEESDLLYSAYGDETGYQYAESILNFAKNSDYMTVMVDNLLDTLTNGEHTKAMKKIDEIRKSKDVTECLETELKTEETQASCQNTSEKSNGDSVSIDYDSLRSLADLGIDVSFLDNEEKEVKSQCGIQKKLNDTSALLNSLQQVQHDRLSLKPPPHLAHVMEPTRDEMQLADKVSESLKSLAKQTTPMSITSLAGLRKAMGITLEPFFSGDESANDGDTNLSSSRMGEEADISVDISRTQSPVPTTETEDQPADLESELQEFLDTGPTLKVNDSPSHGEETLVDENLLV